MTSKTASWPEPPKGLTRTLHNTDGRDVALQHYLTLQEEHETLHQHLSSLRSSRNPSILPVQASYYPAPPSGASISSRSSSRDDCTQRRRSSLAPPTTLDTVMDESTIAEVAAEESRLGDVNEGIKRALTELLNCSTVRGDRAFRTWVQCRLMDTEKELRTGRRRRSAPEYCVPASP